MERLRLVGAPALFALGRIRARPLTTAATALALAGAAALIGWSSFAAALAEEESVRLRLAELPPAERALRIEYPTLQQEPEPDFLAPSVAQVFQELGDETEAPRRVRIWSPVAPADERGTRLVVTTPTDGGVTLVEGRLPAGCDRRACEALALAGDFRLGARVRLGERTVALVVGRGFLAPGTLVDPEQLGSRALLVESLADPLRTAVVNSNGLVVAGAALDPAGVHASELRRLAAELRRESVRLERAAAGVEATAPLGLLDELADRGEIARERLLLVAGQGAALILAFAAFAALSRRAETRLLEEQLTTLGASRAQVLTTRALEAALPSVAGALLALGGLLLAAVVIGGRRDLPAGFVAAALPPVTVVAIVLTAAAGTVLLVAALAPGEGSRLGPGALEVAALTALGVIVWQTFTTGGLDPGSIAAGERASPVLLLLPTLAFFAAGVLLLRGLPPALRLAERLARTGPFGLRLAFLTAARSSGQAAAATSFLAVALGSALFSLNYEGTLERQARDEARFTAGARWRVAERSAEGGAQSDVTPLTRFGAVSSEPPVPVLRLSGGLREPFRATEELRVEVLGLPAARLPALLGWRDGFSPLRREEIARRLRPRPIRLEGPRIAPDATELRVWARVRSEVPRLAVLHFLAPEAQRFHALRLGILPSGWRRLRVPLPHVVRGTQLVGVEVVAAELPPYSFSLRRKGFLDLGRFAERLPDGWRSLPSLDDWAGAASRAFRGAPVDRGLRFGLTGALRALMRPTPGLPEALPGLVSPRVAAAAVDGIVTVDLLGRRVPVRVSGRARLFPTVVEEPSLFLVADYETLFTALNLDQPGLARPTEAWFFRRQAPGFAAGLGEAPFRLESAVGVEPLTERLLNDPLAAGSREVLVLAALAAAVLALVGLVLATRSALASERNVLAEYEALGVPPSTLARSTQLRLLALSLFGVAAGLLGSLVAVRLVGAFVAVTGTAERPLPPIEPTFAWRTGAVLLAVVAVLGAAAGAVLAARAFREGAARRLRA